MFERSRRVFHHKEIASTDVRNIGVSVCAAEQVADATPSRAKIAEPRSSLEDSTTWPDTAMVQSYADLTRLSDVDPF